MTWKHYYQVLLKELSFIIDDGEKDATARIVIEHLTGKSFLEIYINDTQVEKQFKNDSTSILERLKKNEPIQYIFGYTYFDNLKIKVNKSTLIPRPETEELVLNACNSIQNPQKIIDFCTGSGCIAIALAKRFPNAEVIATDISENALNTASENAKIHHVDNRITFIKHDILNNEFEFDAPFDLIVSNPPYISISEKKTMTKQILDFEPSEALFVKGNDNLIFYKRIIENILHLTTNNGIAWFEISHLRKKEFEAYLKNLQFINYEFHKDLFGKSRFLEINKIENC